MFVLFKVCRKEENKIWKIFYWNLTIDSKIWEVLELDVDWKKRRKDIDISRVWVVCRSHETWMPSKLYWKICFIECHWIWMSLFKSCSNGSQKIENWFNRELEVDYKSLEHFNSDNLSWLYSWVYVHLSNRKQFSTFRLNINRDSFLVKYKK